MKIRQAAIIMAATSAILVGSATAGYLGTHLPHHACHVQGSLPDPVCTPGVVNPAVAQDNIATTICRPGWTATIRPPTGYTDALKRQQMADYGLAGSPGYYEEDHLIPLELGGHPSDPRNLWPMPWLGVDGAHAKDQVENKLHAQVCAHQITLAEAQETMRTDWRHAR